MKGWHFCTADRRLGYGDGREIVVGKTLTVDGEPELCERGLHASGHVYDALHYAPGPILCRVELGGLIVHDTDKAVATERTTLAMADATTMLHEYAIWCAERALSRIPSPDPRSVNALAVKRRWLSGEASDDDLLTAWETAVVAALEAAGAGEHEGARAAALAAAMEPAQAAAMVAVGAAGAAAAAAMEPAQAAAVAAGARAAAMTAAMEAGQAAAGEAEIEAQRAKLTRRANLLVGGEG